MKCLLDTHAFLWSVFNPRLLGKKAAPVIRDPQHSVSVSVVSFWEISLKYSVGKLELENVSPEDFPKVAARAGFEILPLTALEAASFHGLPRLEPRDPFDRLIVWQAIGRKLVLISKDSSLSAYRSAGLRVLW